MTTTTQAKHAPEPYCLRPDGDIWNEHGHVPIYPYIQSIPNIVTTGLRQTT